MVTSSLDHFAAANSNIQQPFDRFSFDGNRDKPIQDFLARMRRLFE
jgi:hypothetical protein